MKAVPTSVAPSVRNSKMEQKVEIKDLQKNKKAPNVGKETTTKSVPYTIKRSTLMKSVN